VKRLALVPLLAIALLFVPSTAQAADVFRFYAPPGGAYGNASFERDETVAISITIEHEGAAIGPWFLAASPGNAAAFEPREMNQGADLLSYQLYTSAPPSTDVLKSPPEVLGLSNVVTSGDFSTIAVTAELVAFTIYLSIPSAQFVPSGEYTDTVSLELYTGDYATPGTHVLADTVDVTITGRMAQIIDLYADREPGIRSMDLTSSATNMLIATVYERSNSVTGYTVTITSANLAADTGGATNPYFEHVDNADTLDYALSYGGTPVAGWAGGAAVVTDTASTTAPEWVTQDLRISYTGSTTLAAGDYEDRLVITISAK
jgi:spore coat protein U-like protein